MRPLVALILTWSLVPSLARGQQAVPSLPPASPTPAITPPPVPEPSTVEVPYQDVMTLQVPEASRVLSVNPSIVEAALRAPGVIELRGIAFGQTFLHIWSPAGRVTRALQVVQPIPKQPTLEQQRHSAEARAEHLTLEYQNRFRTLLRGPRPSQVDLNTTTQFDHDLTGHMKTPHGDVQGRVSFQRLNNVNELSSWSASLVDSHVGPLHHFDVYGGDTSIGFSDLTLPGSTIRGTEVRYYGMEPYTAEAFYGRRQLGFSSGLSPASGIANDVFFSGARLQDLRRPWTWGVAYANASGTDRAATQTSQAMEGNSWYWPSEHFGIGGEVGHTQENAYGYRIKSALRSAILNLDTTYRNISERYDNVLGPSAEEGKNGFLTMGQFQPFRPIRLRHRLDVYKDRLFANPFEPDTLNLDAEVDADVDLTRSTMWTAMFGRQKLLGRLFPTDTTTAGTSLRQRLGRFPLLGNGSLFTDYQFRDSRSVDSPSSDFTSHTIQLGVGAPLGDVLYWQVSEQVTFLEDTFTGDRSIPKETTAGLNYFQQFKRIPLSLHSGVNVAVAANAQSPNSFLADENRLSLDGGLRYSLSQDFDLYFNSRWSRRARASTGREYELELETGMRYLFDSGISWEPSASISGIVFQDANGDGTQQTGERGLPQVKVVAGGHEALTDPSGRFYLGRLRGKRAEVAVDLTTMPQGFVPTSPSPLEVDLASPPRMPLYFGFVAQSELRARVFVDANLNGEYDATDVPLEGVHLTLADGTTATTDRSGWAFFRGINAGTYHVTLSVNDLAAGYLPATPVTQPQVLAEGQAATLDFPIRAQRSIGGRVYVDRNRNGRFDDGEPLLANLPVCLDGGLRRVTTREDGRYLFKDVGVGLHRVAGNCRARVSNYLPLNAIVQTVELPPQPTELDRVDFRFGEEAAMMQDITNDVLRARREQAQLVGEMIRARNASGATSSVSSTTEDRRPRSTSP